MYSNRISALHRLRGIKIVPPKKREFTRDIVDRMETADLITNSVDGLDEIVWIEFTYDTG